MSATQKIAWKIQYDPAIEEAVREIEDALEGSYSLSKRSIALLLLQGDEEIRHLVRSKEGERFARVWGVVERTQSKYNQPLGYVIGLQRQRIGSELIRQAVTYPDETRLSAAERLSRILTGPITGLPFLLAVLYFGLYKFVGVFGAGTIVDFLEDKVFNNYINPWINNVVTRYIPWPVIQELLARDYGILTLGLRYALAIILPIVGTFFLMFSIIEDSGYLPRLAMLVDRLFKAIGLNGRAVIPLTLGFGCDTMATLVSRTLETKRERVIATLLLALAIPCSAQLGVILGLLSADVKALWVWAGFISLIFLLVGYLTAKILPGDRLPFYMELPPLRLPRLGNILAKTYTRMQWYLFEVIPLFVFASVLIWIGRLTGLFDLLTRALAPVMAAIGLPKETAAAFLFGFFRRDYGAAGLYDLAKAGLLSRRQLTVASATLTLFVPCVAQFTMMMKERGTKTALAIFGFIFPFAFASGYLLNLILKAMGW